MSIDSARAVRYLEDLHILKSRGRGLWEDSLWRTYNVLRRFHYPTLNYEIHAPTYFRKRWIFDAVRDFREHLSFPEIPIRLIFRERVGNEET